MLTSEKYLVVNAGSSSLKFTAYEMPEKKVLISGIFEKIGLENSFYSFKINGEKIKKEVSVKNHEVAADILIMELVKNNIVSNLDEIKGIGHRVVHGGDSFTDSVVIDDEVMSSIDDLSILASLHNPANLVGIRTMMKAIPTASHVAVFDTAFHETMPEENYMYAVPYEWYKKYMVRKYGFHGTSHKYITKTMQEKLVKNDVNLIICHLGGGASISAIKDGKCFDTSMGLTPLEGLIMGTRSGSIDLSIIDYMVKSSGYTLDQIMSDLNNKSGLLGISGKSDFREVEELALSGDKNAVLALEMFRNSIVKYIAQYYFELDGKIDALVFTAGIGENAYILRKMVIDKISTTLNININDNINKNIASYFDIKEGIITNSDSQFPIWVVPTDEEAIILDDTYLLTNVKKNNEKTKRLVI